MKRNGIWLILLISFSNEICWCSSCGLDSVMTELLIKGGFTLAMKLTDVIGNAITRPKAPAESEHPESDYQLMGCFKDDASDRDLPLNGGSSRKMNKEACNLVCGPFSAKYFGLQSSQKPNEKGFLACWCGNEFGKHGKGVAYDCQNRCPGEEKQKQELCGGNMFNSVYEKT